ncbi:MAG TPA: hypothetical protein VFQ92_22930 [Blastocatellia bacterium]|nr:hypothetical protein [Blastocatellia bacterium]
MNSLKGGLNPEEQQFAIEGPTRFKTERNRHRLCCAQCGEHYFVDERTLQKVTSSLEGDPSEISFYCNDCEEEFQEEAHAH